jgi:hypothetical protein
MKGCGSNADRLQLKRASEPTERPSSDGANSASTWRQAPHGVTGAPSTATTMRRKRRTPALTAAPTATRSAQTVRPYDAFSTLQPV